MSYVMTVVSLLCFVNVFWLLTFSEIYIYIERNLLCRHWLTVLWHQIWHLQRHHRNLVNGLIIASIQFMVLASVLKWS